jgi:hypothetical protein
MRDINLLHGDYFKVIIRKSGNGYSYTWGCYYVCDKCWGYIYNALNAIAPVECELDYKHVGARKGNLCAGCMRSFV